MLREDGIRMALSRCPVIRFPFSEERGDIKRFGDARDLGSPKRAEIVYLLSTEWIFGPPQILRACPSHSSFLHALFLFETPHESEKYS